MYKTYIYTEATEAIEKSLEHPLLFKRNKLLRFPFFGEMKILQLEVEIMKSLKFSASIQKIILRIKYSFTWRSHYFFSISERARNFCVPVFFSSIEFF